MWLTRAWWVADVVPEAGCKPATRSTRRRRTPHSRAPELTAQKWWNPCNLDPGPRCRSGGALRCLDRFVPLTLSGFRRGIVPKTEPAAYGTLFWGTAEPRRRIHLCERRLLCSGKPITSAQLEVDSCAVNSMPCCFGCTQGALTQPERGVRACESWAAASS